MKFWLGFVLIFLATSAIAAENEVNTIIQKSVAANLMDWKAAPGFTCDVQEQEPSGTKTYGEMMILGSPYRRLLAVNGKELTPEMQKKEEQKLRQAVARRQKEPSEQREERIAKYEKERNRDRLMTEQITKAFNFTLLKEETEGGHQVYVLKAMPKPGYRPPNMQAKALTGMQGQLWIDKNDFQWVKVEAETVRPVSIEGFLAVIEPGTRFELEKAPVAAGIWLAKHFAMQSRARILGVFHSNKQEAQTYSNCHQGQPQQASTEAKNVEQDK